MLVPLIALVLIAAEPKPSSASSEEGDAAWLLTVVGRSHPGGGLIGAEAQFALGETVSAGAYLNYMYYWAEMGAVLQWRYLEGLLISSAWLGLEPGNFIPGTAVTDERQPGLRAVIRGRVELNLRKDWWWFYNRLTVEGRVRTFEERDPYRSAILDEELSVEEAFAPLFRILSWGDKSMFWLYAEITVAAEARFGLLDLRPSAGIIVEELFEGFTVDVDFYKSLRDDSPIGGYGVLVLVWWRL